MLYRRRLTLHYIRGFWARAAKWPPLMAFFAAYFFSLFVAEGLYALEDIGAKKDLFKIHKIVIKGSKKVEQEAILEKINSKEGMVLDNYLLKRDLEKIYAFKYFESVEAHQEVVEGKNHLIFALKERPIIAKITFDGNDELDRDDMTAQVKSKEFGILDVNTIKNDVQALEKQYEEKGFYLATVSYELKKLKDENVELIFKVKEFAKVKVKKVTFLGNRAFSDDELKNIMETQEEGLFSWMSNSGNFKELSFNTDIEKLKYFYQTKGHLQANIGIPETTVSEDKKWIFITLKVTEGPKFTVNDISFQGDLLFDDDEFASKMGLQTGNTYSEQLLRKDVQILTEMYQNKGYAFANVIRSLQVVPGENKVDVDFSFERGKMAYFGKITIKGNNKTRDKVIRRELMIREGVKFSGSGLRRSKENVNRLGFFEPNSVIFNTVTPQGKDDVLDVEISVKERNTGQISLGAGYSTSTKFFLHSSIAQNNFRGLGQNLALSLSLAKTNKTYNIGLTEPYLFDSKWTAGGNIFITSNERSESFHYKRKGFDIHLGYPIFDYTRLFGTYKLEDTDIKAHEDPTIDTALENGIASSFKGTLIHDRRNNKFEPSKGYYFSVSSEFAGLGGDKKWLKSEFDARFFERLYGDLVLRTRYHVGSLQRIQQRDIPRTEKFTLGGSRNLRGYSYEAIGPKETVPVINKATNKVENKTFNTGGLYYTFATVEFEHPLAREAGLKWVLFWDAGHAGDYKKFKLRMDYGFGFRWFSPIGVLRFEFGYPIDPSETDAGGQFHFDIGQLF